MSHLTTLQLAARITSLISLAQDTINSSTWDGEQLEDIVAPDLFYQLKAGGYSFLQNVFGSTHAITSEFNNQVGNNTLYKTKVAKGILTAAKEEIEEGWLASVRRIASAEIFSNFLEMSEYLLAENYKDASAVMIGSVLEEHLKTLCKKHAVAVLDNNKKPKKANLLNDELAKYAYDKGEQKSVIAWLDLRNKAAHGEYNAYSGEQVNLMLMGVRDFIARTR